MNFRTFPMGHKSTSVDQPATSSRDAIQAPSTQIPARKPRAAVLAGLDARNRPPSPAKGVATGWKKLAANQLFGTETERRTIDRLQRVKHRLGIAANKIEAVKVSGEGGVLAGHFYKAPETGKSEKIALVLSGSGAPAEMQAPAIAEKYLQNGVGVLAVNYRGFGGSEGTPSEEGFYKDAEAMFGHLVQRMGVAPENVLIHGYAMGAPVAAHLATHVQTSGRGVGGLVLDRPTTSTSKDVRAHHSVIGNVAGQIAKQAVGALSVEKNLRGQSVKGKIVVMTDNGSSSEYGEHLRQRLASEGFEMSGAQVNAAHDDSRAVMDSQFSAVELAFLPRKPADPPSSTMQ